jgi:uncharacterized short protein YbdD (DUF466 family)
MKPLELCGLMEAPSCAASTPRKAGITKGAVLERLRGIRQICRQMFGIPDYERYLAHAAARHPGAPVLSRRAFCDQAIDRKFGKSGPRCC